MNLLLGFLPFLAFAVVAHVAGTAHGLAAGALAAFALLVRDAMTGRHIKLLEIGAAILFGGLALYALRSGPDWSLAHVRLLVDGGLLAIVLASMLVRMPFTMQYAAERGAPEAVRHPAFLRKNYVITACWAAAFGVMTLADIVMENHAKAGVALTVAALWGAVKFTERYARARPVGTVVGVER
ncbi:hypothetical protein [Cupriavidus agavae]|uniref:Transmembrane protein n=1 Tax=Cupriavidus agavae TaxID=1001822 RepID=A0A4V2FH61_9BURK|nr:hypothetical protein [Cupriavidus agavae]RZT39159.1 hypothetical protein EV147_2354 [Cupriavidus agavae]